MYTLAHPLAVLCVDETLFLVPRELSARLGRLGRNALGGPAVLGAVFFVAAGTSRLDVDPLFFSPALQVFTRLGLARRSVLLSAFCNGL